MGLSPIMDVPVDNGVKHMGLIIIRIEELVAKVVPLDTAVRVGREDHKNMPVQPASIRTSGVHPRARTVQPASIMTARALPRHPRVRAVQPASILEP